MAKFKVRLQPGAKRNEILGWAEGVLRVRLTAPPIEGRANKALVEMLADKLHVSRGSVAIVSGLSSRGKLIEVIGLTDDEIATLLR